MRRLLALLTAGAVALTLAAAAPAGAGARPYLGIDTWYGYYASIDQASVVALTDAAAHDGLKRAGYRIIWLDAGWWSGTRNADGSIAVSPTQWPNGMAWLASYIHAHGFEAGIYEESGDTACYNGGAFSGDGTDHTQQDIDTFAGWGFDAVKVDYCGDLVRLRRNPLTVFREFARAIRDDQPQRPMILNACDADTWSAYPMTGLAAWQWGPRSGASSWRTQTDLSYPRGVSWSHVLRNLDADAAHPAANADGRGDPDYLTPGLLPSDEARAQLTMWAMLSAPLMVSADLARLPAGRLRMYENMTLVAVDQNGLMARVMARSGSVQIWSKPFGPAGRERAVAVLNRGASGRRVTLPAQELGLAGPLSAHDVWSGATLRGAALNVDVSGRSARLLLVR